MKLNLARTIAKRIRELDARHLPATLIVDPHAMCGACGVRPAAYHRAVYVTGEPPRLVYSCLECAAVGGV